MCGRNNITSRVASSPSPTNRISASRWPSNASAERGRTDWNSFAWSSSRLRATASREEACARLGRILAEQFPDESLESLTTSPDLEHSLSGSYARGMLRAGSKHWAVLGHAGDRISSSRRNTALTFALLWLDRAQKSCRRGVIAGLRLIVPKGAGRILAHYLQWPEFTAESAGLRARSASGNSGANRSRARPATWIRGSSLIESRSCFSIGRSPASLQSSEMAPDTITVHPVVQSREVWLRFRGLAFARWDDGNVFFGAGDRREKLTPASRGALKRLLDDLENHRHPLATDTRHSLYRVQPERWLESIVRKDVTRIDAALDSRFVYTQVFANSCGQRGILDVLTVTRSGRLAILELKASEHIHLPAAGCGLLASHPAPPEARRFSALRLLSTASNCRIAPPLVYLVAPALRFHPSTDVLLRYFSPEIEFVRVGLAETWRRGLRVVMRQ